MTDSFADVVMPIFSKVIGLQDRLSWGEARNLEEVKKETKSWIEQASRRAVVSPELSLSFELVKFGLVAWIDEVLDGSDWGSSVGWGSEEHVLEWDFYHSHDRAWLFYKHADRAEAQSNMDALETYLLCVTLGFKGEHASDEAQ